MKLLVALCLVAAVTAAPQTRRVYSPENAQILKYENDNDGYGNYRFAFEQSDGIQREEQGEIRNAGSDYESLYVKGFYTYVGNDGVTYTVRYVADDGGFQPEIEEGPGGGVSPELAATLIG